jgi:hypothetical protein
VTAKQTVVSISVALGIGLVVGRYSLPQKVVTKVQTVEVEKKTSDEHKLVADRTTTTTQQVKKPDGTVMTTTVTKNDVQTRDTTDILSVDSKKSDTEKTVTYSGSRWSMSVLAGKNVSSLSAAPTYGASVGYRLLGPVTVGGFGLTNGTVGLSLGLSF